jgi:hypothetical protein
MRSVHYPVARTGCRLGGLPRFLLWLGLWLGLVLSLGGPAQAADSVVAILDFELNDLTDLPATPQELARTGSIKSLLQEALSHKSGLRPIIVDADALARANAGFGYLFDHPDAAAKLGGEYGADWILVGRLNKPSFLFSYLMAHLVNVHTGTLVREYAVEIKGPPSKVTPKGVARLADQIDETIHPDAQE